MKLVQVSTYDIQGGAALAAYRLHRGLREIGEDCRMLVRHKASADDKVFRVFPQNQTETTDEDFFLSTVIQNHYIDSHRTDISNTMFTLPYPGYDITGLPPIQEADIINLHWVAGYQSPITLQRLFQLSKPVVWTLHDQWAFTGGCHYSAGCAKYRRDCSSCPQLADDPFDLPASILQDKLALFAQANLTLVTPSRWLASCVRESVLFKGLRVEVIPNSLDTEFFSPQPKAEAKKDLGLPRETVTLLFGAIDGAEKRKGFQELLTAVRNGLAIPDFRTLVERGQLKILCFGYPDSALEQAGLPVIALGYLDSPEKIRTAYSAADLFILPSLEDNLPNTILEALSCSTPVVAFAAGGIPEVVTDGVNGKLISVGDSHKLAQAILSLVFHPEERDLMGRNGRNLMVEQYPLPVQAKRYKSLYQELYRDPGPTMTSLPREQAIDPPKTEDNRIADAFSVPSETTLASHIQMIFDSVLFRALKRYVPSLYRIWQSTEADRAARMDQIAELTRLLNEAEADRAQLNRQVVELNAHWTVEIRRKLSGLLGRRQ